MRYFGEKNVVFFNIYFCNVRRMHQKAPKKKYAEIDEQSMQEPIYDSIKLPFSQYVAF